MSVDDLISLGTPHEILCKFIHVVQNVCMHIHMEIYGAFIKIKVVRNNN